MPGREVGHFGGVATLPRAAGHEVYTPTYTGLGERSHLLSHDIDLNTHIEDVVMVLRYEDLSDVVLVGHSYGGMVITGVAERSADRLAHLVYLDAFVPQDGQSLADMYGPEAWTALNRVTQCWVRVFSEERGMRSSGRQSRAEVFSLLADYIEAIGFRSFFQKLANQVQAALIDTRVLLAHRGRWPSRSNRFASDLGLVEQVRDPWLRRLTEEAVASPIPIIFGGHGLLSGDLFAICDLL